MMNFSNFWNNHKWTILLVGFGLVLAVLLMTIGFWRSILVILLVALCALLGYLMDKGGIENVRSFFKNLFSGKDSGNS